MDIRAYQDGDQEAVIALWLATDLGVNPLNDLADDIALCRDSGHGDILVGEDGGAIIATIMVGHDGHRGWYYFLATAPDRQRQGLGRAMVEAGEAWLRERGLPKAELMVRDINAQATAFYEALGYVPEPVKVLSRRLDEQVHKFVEKTVETTVTYLEMEAPPGTPPVSLPAERIALLRCTEPSAGFYRYLYDAVGRPWQWTNRTRLTDAELLEIITDEAVEIYVLYDEGEPAGYVELDRRAAPVIGIAYFGIIEHFIGRRLGPYMLDWAIRLAWSYGPERLIVDTCTLDHPKALPMYQRAGFTPYKQETVQQIVF